MTKFTLATYFVIFIVIGGIIPNYSSPNLFSILLPLYAFTSSSIIYFVLQKKIGSIAGFIIGFFGFLLFPFYLIYILIKIIAGGFSAYYDWIDQFEFMKKFYARAETHSITKPSSSSIPSPTSSMSGHEIGIRQNISRLESLISQQKKSLHEVRMGIKVEPEFARGMYAEAVEKSEAELDYYVDLLNKIHR